MGEVRVLGAEELLPGQSGAGHPAAAGGAGGAVSPRPLRAQKLFTG